MWSFAGLPVPPQQVQYGDEIESIVRRGFCLRASGARSDLIKRASCSRQRQQHRSAPRGLNHPGIRSSGSPIRVSTTRALFRRLLLWREQVSEKTIGARNVPPSTLSQVETTHVEDRIGCLQDPGAVPGVSTIRSKCGESPMRSGARLRRSYLRRRCQPLCLGPASGAYGEGF